MTRWKKVRRDLGSSLGRVFMMVLALGLSIAALTGVFSANSILTREIANNYMGTNPASATIETDGVSDQTIEEIKRLQNIADAEARRSVLTRAQFGDGKWQALLLFVIRDFDKMRIGKASPNEGAWPPPRGTVLLERTVLPLFRIEIGGTVLVKSPNGSPTPLILSGSVHDPGLAPAWQERMGYGYITPETLSMLGETPNLDEAKIVLKDGALDPERVNQSALAVADYLKSQGHPVNTIEMPPPGKHPHQNQMVAILVLLMVFSFLALILSAILSASLIEGMMAKEIRNIGIMKTLGGSTGGIALMYGSWIAVICCVALLWALPLGLALGGGLSEVIGNLLNFDIGSTSTAWWVPAAAIGAGIAIPLLVAGIPVARASRMTVWQAISGRTTVAAKPKRGSIKQKTSVLSRTLLMSLRNSFRKRGRLYLTLVLMAAGGAMFMSSLNVQVAWNRAIDRSFANRVYDFAIRLDRVEDENSVLGLISATKGVKAAEAWGFAAATVTQEGDIAISRTYPDGGHGSFGLVGVKPDTDLQHRDMIRGQWLDTKPRDPAAPGQTVLNQAAWNKYGNPVVGSVIRLEANGRKLQWTLTGVANEIGQPAAYVTVDDFQNGLGIGKSSRYYIVQSDTKDAAAQNLVVTGIEKELEAAGYGVEAVIAESDFREAIDGHILILIYSLLAMALIMGTVGLFGLGAATNLNVLERTREIGIMRSIGGRPGVIVGNILIESLFVGLLSFGLALVLALPLSLGLGNLLGGLAFQIPLPLTFSPNGLVLWALIVAVGSLAAASYPAWRASRLSIRETLAYE